MYEHLHICGTHQRVTECVVPALAVTHVAPAPVIEHVPAAPVVECVAPAPAAQRNRSYPGCPWSCVPAVLDPLPGRVCCNRGLLSSSRTHSWRGDDPDYRGNAICAGAVHRAGDSNSSDRGGCCSSERRKAL